MALRSTNITNVPEFVAGPVVDNSDWVVIDSEKEKLIKKNKCAIKKKEQLTKICASASVGSLLLSQFVIASATRFFLLL